MDIISTGKYPAKALSNFAAYSFVVDGIKCNSMEGFLASLKFSSVHMQASICKLAGFLAKKKGNTINWQKNQILYWKGEKISRKSDKYQVLLDKAFESLFCNVKFRKALKNSGNVILKHTIGKTDKTETLLTKDEFCSRLMTLRTYGSLAKPKSTRLL